MEFCLNAAWVARAAERSKNAVSTKMICHNGGLSQISHPTTIDATEFLFIRYRVCDEWKKSGKRGRALRRIDSSLRLESFPYTRPLVATSLERYCASARSAFKPNIYFLE
jgi:hypothetical protein